MSRSLAPILLFTFNRPLHTQEVISSLLNNSEAHLSHLYVFSDGWTDEASSVEVKATRAFLQTVKGFNKITIVERDRNWGLANSIIQGVTDVIKKHGRVIVLEDDLVVAPHFLRFMNDALDLYKEENTIGHIQACDFTNNIKLPDTYLIKWTGSWGWATWDRAWTYFQEDGEALLQELLLSGRSKEFDFDGAYPYTKMLVKQTKGLNNSWAIRWNASLFLNNILSLNVGRSLVQNNGFDGTGTHCGGQSIYDSNLYLDVLKVEKISPIEENKSARAILSSYYRATNSFWAKAMRRIKRIFNL